MNLKKNNTNDKNYRKKDSKKTAKVVKNKTDTI